jgi:hypothetical protein
MGMDERIILIMFAKDIFHRIIGVVVSHSASYGALSNQLYIAVCE